MMATMTISAPLANSDGWNLIPKIIIHLAPSLTFSPKSGRKIRSRVNKIHAGAHSLNQRQGMLWNTQTKTKPITKNLKWLNTVTNMPFFKASALAALYTSMSDIADNIKNIVHNVLSPLRANIWLSEDLFVGMVI